MDDDLKRKIKTALATVGGLATGGVFFGLVGATVRRSIRIKIIK